MRDGLRVELLWWEGCPNTDEALAILREEMASLGLDTGSVELRQVSTDSDAERERFVGSPTIRVDGRDVQPVRDEPIGPVTLRDVWGVVSRAWRERPPAGPK